MKTTTSKPNGRRASRAHSNTRLRKNVRLYASDVQITPDSEGHVHELKFTGPERARLARLAQQLDCSEAELVRRAVTRFLDKLRDNLR